jgi:hypothetical protein
MDQVDEIALRKEAVIHFRDGCSSGHLNFAKYLHGVFKFTLKETVSFFNSGFRNACMNGHLETLQWICFTFPGIENDANFSAEDILHCACQGGHKIIVQWICGKFGCSRKSLIVGFEFAYRKNHFDLAEWIANTYNFAMEESPYMKSLRSHE